jgi:hypothetical protein
VIWFVDKTSHLLYPQFMLSSLQRDVIESPTTSKLFLRGPAGAGKTTCGTARIAHLVKMGIPPDSILVLTPQRTLQTPYKSFLASLEVTGGEVTFATIGGLARRLLDLFWPLAFEVGGFSKLDQPPLFLTLETAQYHMAHIVKPKMDEGYFASVVMDRNRLYSQILDNLNKSAGVGFPHFEIGDRLASAWSGDPAQRRVYADSQSCANEFRRFCLENNLLDFSLQLEIFSKLYWNEPIVRDYIHHAYRHIIYDNIEEDIPLAHDILRDLIPEMDSALLIFDQDAGYRQFLGADPESALSLEGSCAETVLLDQSYITPGNLSCMAENLAHILAPVQHNPPSTGRNKDVNAHVINTRFYPEMLDTVAAEVRDNVLSGISPSEIVVLAPYLSDVLRFSLAQRLERLGIPARSHRPSRSLKDEPACQSLLTFAEIAHPHWRIRPAKYDVVHAFLQAIEGMDLVRAHLLTEIVYRYKDSTLGSFEKINTEMQERITFILGSRYETLKTWLDDYRKETPQPLDHFLRRLFGEVLSQPGFNFHLDLDSARAAASLIESIQKFRIALTQAGLQFDSIGSEYISMLREGVISAQYVTAWEEKSEDAVLIAPAYTFLMSNRPVSIQYWLDVGSSGWYERLFQPLTHPHVLTRGWQPGRVWTDTDEVAANNLTLARLTTGLLRRCKQKIYLCLSELGESGYEQRGILLRAFNQVLSQNDQS